MYANCQKVWMNVVSWSVPNIAIQYTLDPTSKRNNEKGGIDRNKAGNLDVLLCILKHDSHSRHALKNHWISISPIK